MEALSKRQLRYRATKRAPMRDFRARTMTRWLMRNRIDWNYTRLSRGGIRIIAWPELPIDRLALSCFGFSHSLTHGNYYRTAS